ncbi:PQQ-binding-like beta-propeller repeat protein [Streptomyces sparsogenes]|uniref:outer membrane protein assembly factor BamB family protein n=1 Tax=Streptomyces sparsogenes TaxID=67365 RepID=UPI001301EF46|nr:PQQ-binding-like beta-propeller repeat protein [Streptomyces sparsogenes]
MWSWDLPREHLDFQHLDPGQLAADREHVYFGAGKVYAFRLSDGDRVWKFGEGRAKGDIKKGERPYGRPAVKNGAVYVAEGTRGLVAIAADSGKPLWEVSLGGIPNLLASPVIGRKYAYVAVDGNARISAVDLRTHKVAWTSVSPEISAARSWPIIVPRPLCRRAAISRVPFLSSDRKTIIT